ncbi:hypothetical protein ACFYN9_09930 [Streptomyces collinus]|uniref:VMAP-C domain-containing protein n=1 Tax=Streptomyces collinus TaxID=42684 RepID=UPI00369B4462
MQQLCDAICGFSDVLFDNSFLPQIIKHTNKRLQSWGITFTVAYRAAPRDQVNELVMTLDSHVQRERVLRSLRDSLEYFRPDDSAMYALDTAIDALAPAGRLSGRWLMLVTAYLEEIRSKVAMPLVAEAAQRALVPGEALPLRGTEPLPAVVRRLSDPTGDPASADHTEAVQGQPTASPLVLRFLAELAALLPQDTTVPGVLRGYIELAANELELSQRQRADLQEPTTEPTAHVTARVLQILLRETVPGHDEYLVEGTVYDHTDEGLCNPRKKEAEQPVSLRMLREMGRTCLADWQDLASWLDTADRAHVEFLLPWSLLGHPVDRWLTDGDDYLVGHKYPVVVRCLDRLEKPSWHSSWAQRWSALKNSDTSPKTERIGWLALEERASFRPGGAVLQVRGVRGEVRAWLDKHPENTGIGLAFAYDPGDHRRSLGLREAVREGIPLALWRRDGGDPQELVERLAALATEHFFDLPSQIRVWRRAALDDNLDDFRNHLTLLWDNPECTYRCTPMAAPGTGKGSP